MLGEQRTGRESFVLGECTQQPYTQQRTEREFFVDNLLVRLHLITGMILEDRPCAMGL